jgi:GH24 family phage-related lysozyme (muramidase)
MYRASKAGVRFVARHEGFLPKPYAASFDPAGVVTQGFGTTNQERPEIKLGGPRVTKRKARRWLTDSLETKSAGLDGIKGLHPWEVDALLSGAYNLGPGYLTDVKNSTLARRLHSDEAKTYEGRRRIYREEMPKWCKADGVVLEGLRRRREDEVRLACDGIYK